jgi:predicted transcriptional regulator
MGNGEHILISLAARHADNIFAGRKQVELRRRIMHVEPGTIVWIYVKLPIGSIIGRVKVVSVHASSPATLWRRFGPISGLSRSEFFDYFNGVEQGVALVLEDAERLPSSLSLEALREIDDSFQPPQFFVRLTAQHPVLELVGCVDEGIPARST